MNIKQAKEQIKYAVKSYFTKDESGDFIIPVERQRPIFLMGPPGIGKTAIMEQIANELGVGIVTYSISKQRQPNGTSKEMTLFTGYM